MRSLGLRIDDIQALASVYLERPEEPIGPPLAPLLNAAEQRIDEQIDGLMAVRKRIESYPRERAAQLAGETDLAADGPRRHAERS